MLSPWFSKFSTVYVLGLLLLIQSFALLFLSHGFDIDTVWMDPILLFVTILFVSSVVYLLAVNYRFSAGNGRKTLFYIFVVGLLIRGVMLFSNPVLEDDYFRYLWDGAVTANGFNPYTYSPEQVLNDDTHIAGLESLAERSGSIIGSINHPHLSTIYPPVIQVFFAVSYKLAPFNFYFWKFFLLLFDLATFFLLLIILRNLKMPLVNVMIYWWNPLLVNVIFNAGHFEAIMFPFVLSALILAYRKKAVFSVAALVLSIGIKLWPIILFPSMMRSFREKVTDMIKPTLVFLILLFAVFLPLLLVGSDGLSGFTAYSKSWENNGSIFKIILFLFETVLSLMGIHPGHAQVHSRIFILIALVIWVLFQTMKYDLSRSDLFRRSLFIVAAVFLISPTQLPWYYIWLLPLLVVIPKFSLLLLTSQLSLYYLWFYFEPRGMENIFRNVIVWIEFIPVWILLVVEFRKKGLLRNF